MKKLTLNPFETLALKHDLLTAGKLCTKLKAFLGINLPLKYLLELWWETFRKIFGKAKVIKPNPQGGKVWSLLEFPKIIHFLGNPCGFKIDITYDTYRKFFRF